jgi:hypothetical protein
MGLIVALESDGQTFAASANSAGSSISVRSTYQITGLWNGNAWVYPDLTFTVNGIYYADFLSPTDSLVFEIDSSPTYLYTGNNNLIDETGGTWPQSNIMPNPPGIVYVLDSSDTSSPGYSLQGIQVSFGQGWYSEQDNYSSGSQQVTIQRYYTNGMYSGSVSGDSDLGNYFSGTFDPVQLQFSNISPTSIQVSLSQMGGSGGGGPGGGSGTPPPRQGPLFISWDGALLSYQSTDSSGNDYYADSSNQWSVTINNGSVTSGTSPSYGGISGSYSTATSTFSVPDSDFFALDSAGNPIGLSPGLTLLFGFNGPGYQIVGNDGTAYSPNYLYQRPDGSWGLKYSSLPSGVYLVQDEHGIYTAPPYAYSAGNEVIENAISGWPPTNIYPTTLYVNGIACSPIANSQYDSGAGLPRTGGSSYYAPDYDLTVVLSWNWNAGTGFQGFVTGKYGQSASFKGSWDGLSNFTNLTNGAIVSLTPPSNAPADGNPPQVAVNGSALTYNAGLSGSGVDVYTGSLGQQLSINAATGAVSYTPGLGYSGAPITGTYNAATHQFNFASSGNGIGNIVSVGSGSNGYTATISATDSSGHPLATANGGSSTSGGLTNLNGGLDIEGNSLSLGSWQLGNESVYGLAIAYADGGTSSVSQIGLSTTRAAVNWLWYHPSTDGNTDQVMAMELDSGHRLLLYNPSSAGQASAAINLDPVNGASYQVPIRVLPAGDINMGTFTSGAVPGQ